MSPSIHKWEKIAHSGQNAEGRMQSVEGVLGLANHYLATIMVRTGIDKNRQWMLNLGGNFYKEHDICMVSPHCLLVAKKRKNSSNYIVKY